MLRELALAHLIHRVLRGHVSDFVPEHAGELRFVFHVGQQAAGDEDGPPGQRKGVHAGIVHHLEGPGQIFALRHRRQALAHTVHIGVELGRVVDADGLRDFLGTLLTHGHFLVLGDEVQLSLARGRIGDAGPECEQQPEGKKAPNSSSNVHFGSPFSLRARGALHSNFESR